MTTVEALKALYLTFGYMRPTASSNGAIQSINGVGIQLICNASGIQSVSVKGGNKIFE